MKAMRLEAPGSRLVPHAGPVPMPGPGEILVAIEACGVCRTDLHVIDGDLPFPGGPVVPGHEIVGHVMAVGSDVAGIELQARIGVAWLGWTCGHCRDCLAGRENLCDRAAFTGYTRPGGYADHVVVDARFAIRLPEGDAAHLAPLLCAGLIGFRAYRFAEHAVNLGFYGFGAAAHILAQVAAADGRHVFAFTRPGDLEGQAFARSLGATWAGDSTVPPPEPLDAAIIFAPVGALVPAALRGVRKGGSVICAGIHMSDIPSFPYADLWGERRILSVANLTRADAAAFFAHPSLRAVRTRIERFPLVEANAAIQRVRDGSIQGAAVLIP